jgi:hypothetical protein
VGLLSGAVAVSFRKGSHGHRIAGIVFAMSMLSLGASGAYLAIMKFQPGNILGGIFTFYLVATSWMTVRRREAKPGIFDWGALLVILTVAAIQLTFGFQAIYSRTGLKYGYHPGPYFFIGSIALLLVVGDIRMLVRGGVSGTQRLVRHLWRMCFAWFIASASIFLARPHLFPVILRKSGVLYLLTLMPLIFMFFWLARVRFAKAYRGKSMRRRSEVYPLPPQPSAAVFGKTNSSSAT